MASSSKVVIFFCMAVLLATAASAAHGIKEQKSICSRVNDWENDKQLALCKKLAGQAETWEEAMPKMLATVRHRFLAGKHIAYGVADMLPKSIEPIRRESAGRVCQKVYEMTLDDLNQAIDYLVQTPNGHSLTLENNFETCIDTLKEKNLTLPEVERFNKKVHRLFGAVLAVASIN